MKICTRVVVLGAALGFWLGAQTVIAGDPAAAPKPDAAPAAPIACPQGAELCRDCCRPEWTPFAGVEDQFLWSHVPNRSNFLQVAGTSVLDPKTADIGGFQPSGLAWLGFENRNGLGFRGRYWSYDQSESNFQTPPFELQTVDASVVAYTIDLEVTKRLDWNQWNLLASVRARYASLNERASFSDASVDFAPVPAINQSLGGSVYSRFNGAGVTTSLEAIRPINGHGLNFIASGRGSFLDGTSVTGAAARIGVGGSSDTSSGFNSANETHSIFELQTGFEWSVPVECVKGVVFARAVFDYQLWSGANVPTSIAIGGPPTVTVNSPSQKLDFLGPVFSVGFCW